MILDKNAMFSTPINTQSLNTWRSKKEISYGFPKNPPITSFRQTNLESHTIHEFHWFKDCSNRTSRYFVLNCGYYVDVGKTCLSVYFIRGRFSEHSTTTIGASFLMKTITTGNVKNTLKIWDTAGMIRWRPS